MMPFICKIFRLYSLYENNVKIRQPSTRATRHFCEKLCEKSLHEQQLFYTLASVKRMAVECGNYKKNIYKAF